MKKDKILSRIEKSFRKTVQKDEKVRNAYLLVESDKLGVQVKLAEGSTGDFPADVKQPNYLASAGKIFTSTIIGILYEEGRISFNDSITQYLEQDLLAGLHVYQGRDYSEDIKVKHLLKHTSGLDDYFWPLVEKLIANPEFKITTREAFAWGKEQLEPAAPPGERFKYTDTNYHLLGFIIEEITGLEFHQALSKYIFQPLALKESYMLGFSAPQEELDYPMADFYFEGRKIQNYETYGNIDYAGGGVVAPLDDWLKFMKALVNHEIISAETLEIMKQDKSKFRQGIDYGYGIWQIKTIPIIMPKKLNAWGVVGVTGSFLFYHPLTESYVIGSFHESSYESKAVRFMLLKVLKQLAKLT